MSNQSISRKAILFGAPGGKSNSVFLPGVAADLQNMKRFLSSPNGGSWYENEIVIINYATSSDVLLALTMSEAEYLFVYFSGHGFTRSDTNQRILCLQDNTIEDKSLLLNKIRKQLIIIDACRTYSGSGIGSIPPTGEEYAHFDGSSLTARKLFDEYIRISPPGKAIVHGTQTGYPALDSSFGGYFTKALLIAGTGIKSGKDYTAYSISKVLQYVPGILKQYGNTQIPAIPYQNGNFQIPFAIEMPVSENAGEIRRRPLPVPDNSWTGAALLILLIAGLGGVFDQ